MKKAGYWRPLCLSLAGIAVSAFATPCWTEDYAASLEQALRDKEEALEILRAPKKAGGKVDLSPLESIRQGDANALRDQKNSAADSLTESLKEQDDRDLSRAVRDGGVIVVP